MVWCMFIWNATFNFVPTPSALETSTGFLYRAVSSLNRPPNPPISLSTCLLKVRWARYLMRCLVRSPLEMSTPASAYVIAGAGLDDDLLGTGVAFRG